MTTPPYGADAALGWQAYVIAQTSAAMLGLISRQIRAVAVRITDDGVELHFAVPGDPALVAEDIEEICFELDVLFEGHTRIVEFVHPVERFDWADRTLLGVYAAKPGEASSGGEDL